MDLNQHTKKRLKHENEKEEENEKVSSVFYKLKNNVMMSLSLDVEFEELQIELVLFETQEHFFKIIDRHTLQKEFLGNFFERPSQVYFEMVDNSDELMVNAIGDLSFCVSIGRKGLKEICIPTNKSLKAPTISFSDPVKENFSELEKIKTLEERIAQQDEKIEKMGRKLQAVLERVGEQQAEIDNLNNIIVGALNNNKNLLKTITETNLEKKG